MTISKEMSRREFLKLSVMSAASVGLLYISFPKLGDGDKTSASAAPTSSVTEFPIIWLATGACTGCSVSLLNSLSPSIRNILVDEVVPNKHLSLRFHATVMASEGDLALQVMKDTAAIKGGYILVVDGSVSTKDNGVYCEIGEENGTGLTGWKLTKDLSKDAMAVIAIGTCASYGGIPSAAPNTTGCSNVKQVLADANITTPVINVPGCPPHPDWFVGTVATILLQGLNAVELDSDGRPLAFYGKRVHENCPRNGYFQLGQFSKKFSDPYCMYQLGCKGPITYADCPIRLWNSGTNWCVGCNSLCIGCVQPGFPDITSPFMKKAEDFELNPLATPPAKDNKSTRNTIIAAGLGAVAGAAVVGAGVVAAQKLTKKESGKKEQKE
jgi:hydrogenase small subunit